VVDEPADVTPGRGVHVKLLAKSHEVEMLHLLPGILTCSLPELLCVQYFPNILHEKGVPRKRRKGPNAKTLPFGFENLNGCILHRLKPFVAAQRVQLTNLATFDEEQPVEAIVPTAFLTIGHLLLGESAVALHLL